MNVTYLFEGTPSLILYNHKPSSSDLMFVFFGLLDLPVFLDLDDVWFAFFEALDCSVGLNI